MTFLKIHLPQSHDCCRKEFSFIEQIIFLKMFRVCLNYEFFLGGVKTGAGQEPNYSISTILTLTSDKDF